MPQQTIFIVGVQTVRGLGRSQSSEPMAAVLTACFVASAIIQILVHMFGYTSMPHHIYILCGRPFHT